MSARRFRLEIGGEVMIGLAFCSDAELDAFLAGRGLGVDLAPRPSERMLADTDPGARGRPSYDDVIDAAVRAVAPSINGKASKTAIARSIRAHIAREGSADIPSERTVMRRIAPAK